MMNAADSTEICRVPALVSNLHDATTSPRPPHVHVADMTLAQSASGTGLRPPRPNTWHGWIGVSVDSAPYAVGRYLKDNSQPMAGENALTTSSTSLTNLIMNHNKLSWHTTTGFLSKNEQDQNNRDKTTPVQQMMYLSVFKMRPFRQDTIPCSGLLNSGLPSLPMLRNQHLKPACPNLIPHVKIRAM